MTYAQALAKKHTLEIEVNLTSAALKAFPRDTNGLIRDGVLYKDAKTTYDLAFYALREFNAVFVKKYKAEYAQTRKAYRRSQGAA